MLRSKEKPSQRGNVGPGVAGDDEDVIADDVVRGHVIVGGLGHAQREVALDETTAAPLIEIVGRGAVAGTDVGDIPRDIATEDGVFGPAEVDRRAVAQHFHAVVDEVVLEDAAAGAVADTRVRTVVNLVVADEQPFAAALKPTALG